MPTKPEPFKFKGDPLSKLDLRDVLRAELVDLVIQVGRAICKEYPDKAFSSAIEMGHTWSEIAKQAELWGHKDIAKFYTRASTVFDRSF